MIPTTNCYNRKNHSISDGELRKNDGKWRSDFFLSFFLPDIGQVSLNVFVQRWFCWALFDDYPIWPMALLFLTMHKILVLDCVHESDQRAGDARRNLSIIDRFEDGIDYQWNCQKILRFLKMV